MTLQGRDRGRADEGTRDSSGRSRSISQDAAAPARSAKRPRQRPAIPRMSWRYTLPMVMVLGVALSGVLRESPHGSIIPNMAGLMGTAAAGADGRAGLWTGSSHVTFSRSTNDFTVGYTMRSDFWFRVDSDGSVRGNAYAVYQPTFDAAGMNSKITIAKSIYSGALSLLPGGQIGVYKNAIDAGKAGTNVALSGLVGVAGEYEDPEPVRTGKITGALRTADEVGGGASGTLTLAWADESSQATGIPAKISLQYINKKEPITSSTLKIQTPWRKPATIDPDSDGRFAIAQDQQKSSKEGMSESTFSYWNATRVE
ncbi:MAG: hypothetical protein ACRD2X_24395 [Vicinamibacteraceae bacterium]